MKKLTLPGTFLDDEFNQPLTSADAVFFGVGYEGTASYGKGTRLGPEAILDASHQLEYDVPGLDRPLNEVVRMHLAGVLVDDPKKPSTTNAVITTVAQEVDRYLQQKKFFVILGGEHSISNGVWQGMAKHLNPHDVTILHFDAHLDMRDEYDGGKESHACVLRRAVERGYRVVSVGVRDHISEEERQFVASHEKEVSVWWCASQPYAWYGSAVSDRLLFDGRLTVAQLQSIVAAVTTTKYLYITFDVDVLDPSVMAATGTPLPNGLSVAAVQDVLFAVIDAARKKQQQFIGMDVVELAPIMRKSAASRYEAKESLSIGAEISVAKLVFDVLSWKFCTRKHLEFLSFFLSGQTTCPRCSSLIFKNS